jgi:tetratricopeptide (TPR) repeat protein
MQSRTIRGRAVRVRVSIACALSLLCAISCSPDYRSGGEVTPHWEWTQERSDLDRHIEYLLDRGSFDEALSLADSVMAAAGRDPRTLEQKARALAGIGRTHEATAFFEESILGDYEACESHLNFAVFLMGRGKTGRAITEFNVAKRFCAGKNMAIIHRNLAVVNMEKGEFGAALDEVFAGLGFAPEDPYLLGLEAMLIAEANPGRAESLFTRLREAGRLSPDQLHSYGVLLLKGGAYEKAVEVLEQALAQSPDEDEIRLNLGTAYEKGGDYAGAEKMFRAVIAESARERVAHELAGVLYRTGRFAEALDIYMSLPPTASVMDRIALCHLELGNLDEALRWSRRAVKERPNWPTAMANLAVILAARGELEEAAALLEQVLSIDPDHATARDNLERLRSAREKARR